MPVRSTPLRRAARRGSLGRGSLIFAALFLVGAGVRAVDLWRPVDGRLRYSWRECDDAAMARNYDREGMNILYPRIDWRGDGPGYVESEFPIYPWSVGVLYQRFGIHEVFGRIVSYLLALAALVVFCQLASYLLPFRGAVAASLFVVLNPLHVSVSNSWQPESLMFLSYLGGAYAFIRWLDSDSWSSYALAVGATALAILVKLTPALLGLFFLALLLDQKGVRALGRARVWLF